MKEFGQSINPDIVLIGAWPDPKSWTGYKRSAAGCFTA